MDSIDKRIFQIWYMTYILPICYYNNRRQSSTAPLKLR